MADVIQLNQRIRTAAKLDRLMRKWLDEAMIADEASRATDIGDEEQCLNELHARILTECTRELLEALGL